MPSISLLCIDKAGQTALHEVSESPLGLIDKGDFAKFLVTLKSCIYIFENPLIRSSDPIINL